MRPDATDLAALLRTGETTPSELTEAAVAALEELNPELNAVIHPRYDAARAEAADMTAAPSRHGAGPFAGVPMVVKDLRCGQAGEPHHRGARFLAEAAWTEKDDSYLWRDLRRAGFISLGRTNTPEFGSTITTEPLAYGPTHNPWNLALTPGGSSGGSAAVVAARVVPVAHGNDGGGSLRVPAAMCGLVGLKPNRGRISAGPQAGISRGGFASDGVLSVSVRDTAAVLDEIMSPRPGDPITVGAPTVPLSTALDRVLRGLRIGVTTRLGDPTTRAAVEHTAALLESLGHVIHPDEQPTGWFDPELGQHTVVIRTVGMATDLRHWGEVLGRAITEADVEPSNWFSAQLGASLPATAVIEATDWLHSWSRTALDWWARDHDLLLSPVVGTVTPELGVLSDPHEGQRRLGDLLGFVDQANVSGQPAMSLPLWWDERGMPVGIQLVAAPGREDVLISVAAQLERAQPWAGFLPPMVASRDR